MRLVNTATCKLEEFSGRIPEYAILSHTWEEQEMSFQDMQGCNAEKTAGFAKVKSCCELVEREGFEYVWIDTCCIDKTSSAELSEAINSMYRWYKEAQVCVAYLVDVPSEEDPHPLYSAFARSKWFTRGWTLQELIAPPSLEFYGKDWSEIGTKLSLHDTVSKITGIPIPVLKLGDVGSFSVAQRMSWASKRQTTRIEDMAYCLMGLFDASMPMLYGEGKRAFIRLQEEIMKISDDYTLFTWTASKEGVRDWIGQGLLADSPADFVHCGNIRPSRPALASAPFSMTNLGLRMELHLIPWPDDEYLAIISCQRDGRDGHLLGLRLKQPFPAEKECFARMDSGIIIDVEREKVEPSQKRIVYITRNEEGNDLQQPLHDYITSRMSWTMMPLQEHGYDVSEVYPDNKEGGSIEVMGRRSNAVLGALKFKNKNAGDFIVVLGRFRGRPWCDIVTDVGNKSLQRVYETHSFVNRLDRITKRIQAGLSVSVAIRKQGGKLKAEGHDYDEGYCVYIKLV
jgi:hypothetical protein